MSSSSATARRAFAPHLWAMVPTVGMVMVVLVSWLAGGSSFIRYNTLIVLLGTSLLGANAGLVGSFTVLRGRALVGDVLAHAALPGLCLAFLLLGQRNLTFMLAGALVSGLCCVALITLLRRWTRIKDDAAMGTVRSVFFGAGIALISIIQGRVTAGSKAGLDSYIFGKTSGMLAADVWLIGGVSLVSLLAIVLLYKEFRLASFDPGFARVQGWPALLLDNVQMALAAVTTVVALPAVGAVLVAALLILPGATMRFWTDRFTVLLVGAACIGAGVSAVGTLCSAEFSMLPTGPIIILVGAAIFTVTLLCAPRRGLVARLVTLARFRGKLRLQKLLRALVDAGESQITPHSFRENFGWSAHEAQAVVRYAAIAGLIESNRAAGSGALQLTAAGRERAAAVARGYRLWQQLFADYPDQAAGLVDLDMEQIDEVLPGELIASLEESLQTARAAGQKPADRVAQVKNAPSLFNG